ncbi:FtsX-like permease family protein [Microbacterium sp. CFBP9034]|uniref:FtsX-like permease family protein n=1 Tax=Microbacterium sp. CFBP9034 TaxID=3096540 RepID=UPI002A6AEF91|nr:FtsX-like permease family protein [Microbacterium sp. CFBP9034]MDY0909041.1 FtsX-like permease family protein [Microbacterium sp. CFBP9034]
MTGLLEARAEASAPDERVTDAAPRRRSRGTRLRADVRLARRQVWRTKGSSALVVALVALPVAGLAGGATLWQSHQPTPEQAVTLALGAHESWIEIIGGPDPSRWQAIDEPNNTSVDYDPQTGVSINPELPPPSGLPDLVPADATVLATQPYGSAAVETENGVGWLTTVAGEVWAPSFRGLYVPLDGAAPTQPDEFMVTPGALERIGARIGDEVVFPEQDLVLTISGTMRPANDLESSVVLFLPSSAAASGEQSPTRWYVEDWQPSMAELEQLNHAGYIAYARDLVLDPPPGARLNTWGSGSIPLWNVLLIGGIAAVICGYVVVLLAGAAFSVAARRQQRALAVAASVGASRGDVFRIVVLQGFVLGAVGGVVGAVIGVAAAAAFLAATDRGALGTFWGNFGLTIPWLLIVPIVLFALLVGTIAALAPARAATRGDTLSALRGARRPALLRPHRPVWAIVVMSTGLAALVAGGLYIAGTLATGGDTQSVLFAVALYAIVLGPVVFQVGLLIPSHWVLVQISRIASPIGLAPRLASRDAAANPSRVAPAFAVIGACIFAASFALSMTAMTTASNARQHMFQAPEDALVVQMWQTGSDASAELVAAAEGVVAPTTPQATVLVEAAAWPEMDDAGAFVDPDESYFAVARQAYDDCEGCELQPYDLASGSVHVVEPDDVGTLLGTDVGSAALDSLRAGGAIVTDSGYVDADDEIVVTQWTAAGHQDLMSMGSTSEVEPEARHPLPAVIVDPGHQQPYQIIVTPQTAADLGMVLVPSVLVATYDVPLEQSEIDLITAQTMDMRVAPDAGLYAMVETGPAAADPWLWLISGVAMTLVLGASAVALGLARFERRPDDATLTAVGGGRMLRRNVNAWQAAVIVGLGALVGTLAGSLSVWGMAMANPLTTQISDLPWLWLAILAIGLPLAIAAVAWLVPPRHPDLTRRTAIT